MVMSALYTIGHSNHSHAVFLELLAQHSISAVADVRSSPYSLYMPEYNRPVIEAVLRRADITYVFLGQELGARRNEESCYVDGRAKYERIALLPQFQKGLERLYQGIERYRVALMCAEADPIACHRTILVCREVKKTHPGLQILHIHGDGDTEKHETLEERLVALHKLQPELFGDLTTTSGLIDKAYALQAAKLECRQGQEEE